MKNYKRIIATAMAILTLTTTSCLTLAGCGCSSDGSTITTTAPLTEEIEELVSFKTPYGNLEYRKKDEKSLVIKEVEKKDSYTVKFKAKIDGKTIDLFDVAYGEAKGDYMGKVKKDGKKVDVYLNSYDVENPDYSESLRNKACAIHENINPVITSIEENPDFVG